MNILRQCLVCCLSLVVLIATPVHAETGPQKTYSKENPVSMASEDGKYQVTLYSNAFPLPMNKIHSWTVKVTTPDGKPVEGATLRIHGGMPAHRHGFPTTPRVKKYLGNGEYRIDGVKFSMPGHWEMRINIKQEDILIRDRTVFEIDL